MTVPSDMNLVALQTEPILILSSESGSSIESVLWRVGYRWLVIVQKKMETHFSSFSKKEKAITLDEYSRVYQRRYAPFSSTNFEWQLFAGHHISFANKSCLDVPSSAQQR